MRIWIDLANSPHVPFFRSLSDEFLQRNHELLVTVEENTIMGGAGSAVLESLSNGGFKVPVLQLGLPDVFLYKGEPKQNLTDFGLDRTGIVGSVRARLSESSS